MSQEERFPIKPEGVRYICENCHKGEMKYTASPDQVHLNIDARLYPHKCEKCGMEMMLPRVYPYIDWIPMDKKEEE